MSSFDELIKRTRELTRRFGKQLDKRDRLLDLVEEVGELAQAVLIVEKRKTMKDPAKQRAVEDVADAICDSLFDLIMLAEEYGLDLGKEYGEMLDRLEKRLDSGEFTGKR